MHVFFFRMRLLQLPMLPFLDLILAYEPRRRSVLLNRFYISSKNCEARHVQSASRSAHPMPRGKAVPAGGHGADEGAAALHSQRLA